MHTLVHIVDNLGGGAARAARRALTQFQVVRCALTMRHSLHETVQPRSTEGGERGPKITLGSPPLALRTGRVSTPHGQRDGLKMP